MLKKKKTPFFLLFLFKIALQTSLLVTTVACCISPLEPTRKGFSTSDQGPLFPPSFILTPLSELKRKELQR